MAARALWKGQLRLSLVAIPVEIYSATRSGGGRIRFRQIHEPSGEPVRYEKVAEGIGPVDRDEIVKGYEYEKGRFVLIDPKDIDAIKLETKKTLELVQFVGACEIPPLYYDKPYYVVPADDLAEDAYRVVRDALRQTEKVGLGQLTLRGREYLSALRPCGDGLLLETLRYSDEIRDGEPMFSNVTEASVDEELLDVATSLIERKTAPFDASAYGDSYAEALRELIEHKTKNKRTKRVETSDDDRQRATSSDNVVDLMDALKKSLEGSDRKKQGTKAGGRPKRSPGGRRKSGSGHTTKNAGGRRKSA